MNILITLYGNTERYPPTINAIECLSTHATKIDVFHRAHQEKEWTFTQNVTVISDGKVITPREQEKLPIHKKIGLLFRFCRKLLKLANTNKYDLILIYDAVPLLAYQMIKPFLKHKMVAWYHNHDVIELQKTRKYSINWWAGQADIKMMPKLDIFSLPAEERKEYFQTENFKGKYFFIPNFPRKSFYSQYKKATSLDNEIKIIFQGSIGLGHGIEELMEMLPFTVNEKSVKLVLKGFVRPAYYDDLMKIVERKRIHDYIEFIGITPYEEIPRIASECQIGISIFTKQDVMNRTLGTASNKIYEYTAIGLPMLYYNDEHYTKHLGSLEWAIPVDLSSESFIEAIKYIDDNYERLSVEARNAFMNNLNFETYFNKVIPFLKSRIQ